MNENRTTRKYKTALIIVSALLISVLMAQGMYWTIARTQSGQTAHEEQTAQTDLTAQAEQAAQEDQIAQADQTAQEGHALREGTLQ